jgi:GNAT superfamily N-acetyltransferase
MTRISFQNENTFLEDMKRLYSSPSYRTHRHSIFKEIKYQDYDIKFYSYALGKTVFAFIYYNNDIIGILEAKKTRDHLELYSVCIHTDHQRKGIYTAILSHLRKYTVCKSDFLQTEKAEKTWRKLNAKKIGSCYYLDRVF